ncbi:helix-turn-helix protein [bacterium BMS3Bbin10]|nr:helix-turn-helix protein [bacterium BMS3Bbin10]
MPSDKIESKTAKPSAGKKSPNPIDVHVGSRVRLRRMLVGLSQEKLGRSMGLTFQQIQKYEKGLNRIGASRLYKLSQILNVPVGFFYEGMNQVEGSASPGMAEENTEAFLYEFLNTRDGLELNRAFVKVSDASIRKSVIDLVRSLGRDASKTRPPRA